MLDFMQTLGEFQKVYTMVDFYQYIKTVEYLICIGFFVGFPAFYRYINNTEDSEDGEKTQSIKNIEDDAAKNTDKNLLIGALLIITLLSTSVSGLSQNIPDSINLDFLVQYYERVVFDHSKHVGLSKDCTVCHHHTAGTAVESVNCIRCHKNSGATAVVSCRGCHAAQPFSAEAFKEKLRKPLTYHKDTPGLRGAYHQSCRGCHIVSGGPTGCQDCHPRKKEGDALYNAGKYIEKRK